MGMYHLWGMGSVRSILSEIWYICPISQNEGMVFAGNRLWNTELSFSSLSSGFRFLKFGLKLGKWYTFCLASTPRAFNIPALENHVLSYTYCKNFPFYIPVISVSLCVKQ